MSTYRDMASGDILISRSDFVNATKLGGDAKLLKDPTGTFARAFEAILEKHEPEHKVAIFSLCTADRPYSVSDKWKLFIERFEAISDLIVYSNGGVIPLPFEHQFPFKTYDAKATPRVKIAERYREVVGGRIKTFLETHRYDHVIFATLVKNRFRPALPDLCAELAGSGCIKGFAIMPDEALNEKIEALSSKNFHDQLQPLSTEPFLQALERQLQAWGYGKEETNDNPGV